MSYMKPEVMWFIAKPGPGIYYRTNSRTRKEAQDHMSQSYKMPWKELHAMGFRAVKCCITPAPPKETSDE